MNPYQFLIMLVFSLQTYKPIILVWSLILLIFITACAYALKLHDQEIEELKKKS